MDAVARTRFVHAGHEVHMVSQKPVIIEAGELTIQIPADLPTHGRGSGRARAFEAGVRAAMDGSDSSSCPYESERGAGSFRKQWMRGYEAFHAAQERKAQRVAS